ncbi:MAG: hypothetical protein ACI32H_01965 [Bacilli bacterium]
MTKKVSKNKIIILILMVFILIIIFRLINGIKIVNSRLEEKEDLYFRVTLNDEVLYGNVDVIKTYNLIPGILKVIKEGGTYITFDNDFNYTHNKYKLIDTKSIDNLIINLEVYKCYKNKFISNTCDDETKYFKKMNIVVDEIEIRRIGINSNNYNELVYKGKFNKNIYSYVKDTDYYTVKFKYKDGSKIYSIDYNFFTNVLNPEVL